MAEDAFILLLGNSQSTLIKLQYNIYTAVNCCIVHSVEMLTTLTEFLDVNPQEKFGSSVELKEVA